MTPTSLKPVCDMDLKLLHSMPYSNLHNLEKFIVLASLKLGQGQKLSVPGPKLPLYGPKHLSFNEHDH